VNSVDGLVDNVITISLGNQPLCSDSIGVREAELLVSWLGFCFRKQNDDVMFGFSLAFFNETVLLVGAPKLNTTQQDVIEAGGVFRCSVQPPYNCLLINIDPHGDNYGKCQFSHHSSL